MLNPFCFAQAIRLRLSRVLPLLLDGAAITQAMLLSWESTQKLGSQRGRCSQERVGGIVPTLQKTGHVGFHVRMEQWHHFFHKFHAGHATGFKAHATSGFRAENHTHCPTMLGFGNHP
mmetsp:Transcript_19269/g.46057  ORF Transcript_19269/g.46057 Transcript_19269/m.46057 type:complete len:118 (+) Transcript_19269:146-499(+)